MNQARKSCGLIVSYFWDFGTLRHMVCYSGKDLEGVIKVHFTFWCHGFTCTTLIGQSNEFLSHLIVYTHSEKGLFQYIPVSYSQDTNRHNQCTKLRVYYNKPLSFFSYSLSHLERTHSIKKNLGNYVRLL